MTFYRKKKSVKNFLSCINFNKETFINLIDFFYFNTKDV